MIQSSYLLPQCNIHVGKLVGLCFSISNVYIIYIHIIDKTFPHQKFSSQVLHSKGGAKMPDVVWHLFVILNLACKYIFINLHIILLIVHNGDTYDVYI